MVETMDLPDKQANISASHFTMISGILSNAGRNRPDNEDYALAYIPDQPQACASDGCLFIVADGASSWTGGEAAQQVLASYYEFKDLPPGDRLKMALWNVNSILFERQIAGEMDRFTTTLVAAVVRQNILTVANVGNSRAYLIHDGQAQQITRDHDLLSELMHMDALSMAEVEQASKNNRLTRCLGGQENIEVDVFANIPLYAGDIILLCSDGIAHHVSDEQIALLVGTGSPDQDCRHLVNWAVRSGSEDDVTALVVLLQEEEPGLTERFSSGGSERKPESLSIPEARSTYRKPKTKLQFGKGGWIGLALLLAAVLLLAFWGRDGMRLFQPAVLVEPVPTLTWPTVSTLASGTLLQASQAVTQVTVEPSPTFEQVQSPSPSPGLSGNVCLWQVEAGQSLFSIIRRFDLRYSSEDSYFYFEMCDLEQMICAGEKAEIESHASIFEGWLVIIPVADAQACEQGEGIWVRTDESQP